MKKCPFCGEISYGEEFCSNCGGPLADVEPVSESDTKNKEQKEQPIVSQSENKTQKKFFRKSDETVENTKAVKKKAKISNILAIVFAVAVVCVVAKIAVSKIIAKDNDYNAAVALLDSGDYIAAYEALHNLNGYKDSDSLKASIKSDYENARLDVAEVGDTVILGAYEQDNNKSNGKEDIEWIVLAKEGNQFLVISKKALDCKPYNTSHTDVTWETCSLRTWLNDTFVINAFSSEERTKIVTTTVTAEKNQEYNTSAGNDVQDRVFLLSITEAEKYFSSDLNRQCESTAYAIAQGACISSISGNCWWWLRSPGYNSFLAANVDINGGLSEYGFNISNEDRSVRPALWINPKS